MAIHCQLLFTTILYALVAINSIIELSTLAYSKSKNSKTCFLYVRNDKSIPSLLPCTTNIYSNGGVAAYAAIMAIYHGYGTLVASRESHIGRTMWAMPWLLLNALSMILMFISACIYSVGLYITCSNISTVTKSIESCKLQSTSFKPIFIAEITGWISVLLWICLIALEAVRLRRNRRARAIDSYIDPSSSDVVKIGDIPPTA